MTANVVFQKRSGRPTIGRRVAVQTRMSRERVGEGHLVNAAIADAARARKPDLIVMTTQGRGGLGRPS